MFSTESPPVPRRHPLMTPSPFPRRPVARAVSVLMVVLTLFGALPTASTEAESAPRALPRLMRDASAAPDRSFRVLIGRQGGGRDVETYLAGRGQRKVKDLGALGVV